MSDFCPVPWPEEPTPKKLTNCKDCGLYEQGSRMVWGEGNPNASIMIILDNPGARKNKEGKQYVCGTRQTLQETAHQVGLHDSDLYVTYILKRRPKKAYEKERTRQICMQHLDQQLQVKQPKLVFCLGNVAVQNFFRDLETDVKSLRGSIHYINGYSAMVAYHPLAIRRRPNLRKLFLQDWQQVADHYKQIIQN